MEIFRGNPMPGTGRGPGKWGCIMISLRLTLARREIAALTLATVAGRDLDCPWDRLEMF